MSATINLHGPFKFGAILIDQRDPFVCIDAKSDGASVSLLRVSRADCDALVKAALAARDLLPELEVDPAILNDAVADDLPDSALLPAADYIRDVAAEIGPPPATHCPVCGGKLDSNGEHVTRNGATIPAAGVTP